MRKFVNSLLVICAVTAVSCGSSDKGAKKTEAAAEVVLPKVEVATVASRDVVQQVIFTGNVEAEVVNNIAPQSPRRIKEIRFDVGDHVRKGDVLVSLENSALVQSKAQMDNAKIEYDRTDELYKIGGASKSEWDARRLQYEVAKASYENLLENTTLIAPVDGIVTARNYDKGDMAGGLPVLVVEQIRPVKIMINISENLFARVRKGMKVIVNLEAYGDEDFAGSITRIYPTINNATRTFAAEVTVPNRDERVRPGMFARVTLPYGKQNHVVAPDRAVNKLMGSGDRYVYVLEADGTVRYSKVELGRRLGAEWEILSGLESGETVVVKGVNALTNGCKVEVVNK
ncbi:MAG: efflux RND transporter periplasmic adaptor subunit [Rikenellaceae bacterium]|nr:efflux RND transporter periplasmic adaptor subunit [Rikenellaceae bacterium]